MGDDEQSEPLNVVLEGRKFRTFMACIFELHLFISLVSPSFFSQRLMEYVFATLMICYELGFWAKHWIDYRNTNFLFIYLFIYLLLLLLFLLWLTPSSSIKKMAQFTIFSVHKIS